MSARLRVLSSPPLRLTASLAMCARTRHPMAQRTVANHDGG